MMVVSPQTWICPISGIELYLGLGLSLSFTNVFIGKPQSWFHQAPPIHQQRASQSKNVSLCILRIRETCAIYKQWRRQRQHRNICSRKSFYGNEPKDRVTQASVSWPPICDLVTSLTWEKYQHEKQKLIHTADTYIHLRTRLPSAVHK